MTNILRAESDNGILECRKSERMTVWTFVPKIMAGVHYVTTPQEATLCELDHESDVLAIWPIVPYPDNSEYMQPKFSQVRTIRFQFADLDEDFDDVIDLAIVTEMLPGAFTKQWQYGLGLAKRYRPIVGVIEQNSDCTDIYIGFEDQPGGSGSSFRLSEAVFEHMCARIRKIDSLGNSSAMRVKRATVRNTLAESLGVTPAEPGRGRHPLSRVITDSITGKTILSETEQDELVEAASKYSEQLARSRPESLAKIRRSVDIASLDQLIEQFERGITSGHGEPFWQRFFKDNPYILHLAFGYPLVQVQDQASVGGTKLSGSGGRLADFVSKNSLSNNIAIFEIKKPASKLVNQTRYRNNVLPPSSEITGAVLQVLDQRNQLAQSIAVVKNSSRIFDIEPYAIRCCVIAGLMPGDEDARATFESFRANSSMVDIVTFDELLEKLRQLRGLLLG